MLNGNQSQFERNIISESDINIFINKESSQRINGIDSLGDKCTSLSDIAHDSGDNFCMNPRKQLLIYVNFKFSQLNNLQREIAEMYFIKNMTFREISKELKKGHGTIQYHINKIKSKLSDNLY